MQVKVPCPYGAAERAWNRRPGTAGARLRESALNCSPICRHPGLCPGLVRRALALLAASRPPCAAALGTGSPRSPSMSSAAAASACLPSPCSSRRAPGPAHRATATFRDLQVEAALHLHHCALLLQQPPCVLVARCENVLRRFRRLGPRRGARGRIRVRLRAKMRFWESLRLAARPDSVRWTALKPAPS